MGTPIAIKYAVVTAVLLGTFLIILGYFLYSDAVAKVDREINDKGINLVTQAATSIASDWPGASVSHQERDRRRKKLETWLGAYVKDTGARGVLDVFVLAGMTGNTLELNARGNDTIEFTPLGAIDDEAARVAGVTITRQRLQSTPVRSYERPLRVDGEGVGRVRLFITAQAVDDVKSEIQSKAIQIVFVALVIGIIVSVFVGGVLTRPIRILKGDMLTVSAGDLHHKSRIRTGDELEQLAATFNRMTSHLEAARDQEASRKALERELAIATSIQTALLPDRIPVLEGYELFPYYESAKEVGGDYYDFIELDGGRQAVVVADVSGKGIPGSLVMTMTRSLVRMASRGGAEPARILDQVNRALAQDTTRGMFVTLILAELHAATGRVRIARAGHNPAFLYRAAENKMLQIQPTGIALGMDPGDLFQATLKIQEFELQPGDVLTLYTDGIVEAMDPEGNEYTSERFAAVLQKHHEQCAREIVEKVMQDLESHTQGAEASDDITLIVLKRTV